MSGPRKFLSRLSAYALLICAGLVSWRIGGGPTSSTLVWYGALGTLVLAVVVQSEWPRNADGSFMGPEEAREQPRPPKTQANRFVSAIAVYGVPLSLLVGVLAKCTGN